MDLVNVHNFINCCYLFLWSWHWLGEGKEWQGKVDKTILVCTNLFIFVDQLQEKLMHTKLYACTTTQTSYSKSTRTPRTHACTHISVSNTQTYKHTLYISRHTSPTTSEVVVAIAGMILPAINLLYTHNIV